ncbi:MAG: hypothetical protein Q8L66_10025 [Caulobacter sp.]|nr:hypothetical protein [Caulobacter sp.]
MQNYIIQFEDDDRDGPLVLTVIVDANVSTLEETRGWLSQSPDRRTAQVWCQGQCLFQIASMAYPADCAQS